MIAHTGTVSNGPAPLEARPVLRRAGAHRFQETRMTARLLRILAVAAILPAAPAAPAGAQEAASRPYVIEYYYKAKWGHQQEFLDLFKKNHLPILLKEKEKGRILEVTLTTPRYHGTEEGRWDFRVTLTFTDLAAAHGEGALTESEIRQLYPDKAAFDREEQRRFAILDAHWDLPVQTRPFRP